MKKKILLITIIIILFGVAGFLVARVVQSGTDLVFDMVQSEQKDHEIKMRTHIDELRVKVKDFKVYVEKIETRQWNAQDREDIALLSRSIEESSLNISRRSMFYYEDTTAHLFFGPHHEIAALFDEVRNTPLYIDRFIRAAERGAEQRYINTAQKESIIKNYILLEEEIERIIQ